ncbi:MAG: Hsp20/alpha crystallin family protein [Nodosilinea sp.]
MPMPSGPSMWDLGAAQAQMEAIAAALMPVDIAPSGRLQLPSTEIQEADDRVVVTAFLPGVEPQAVQVRATPRSLTFFGQRRSGYRSPLGYGLGLNHFQQTIPLPAKVQDRQMRVTYCQGAIVVTLPKARSFWARWAIPQRRSRPPIPGAGRPMGAGLSSNEPDQNFV